jgi:hypothetical protein
MGDGSYRALTFTFYSCDSGGNLHVLGNVEIYITITCCISIVISNSCLSWQSEIFYQPCTSLTGHAVAQWLRHCGTNRQVAGSIPDGVIGIFHWLNPSGRTMALGSTQPLTNEKQEYFLGIKAASSEGWQPYALHVPVVLKSGSLNLLGPPRPVMGLLYLYFWHIVNSTGLWDTHKWWI